MRADSTPGEQVEAEPGNCHDWIVGVTLMCNHELRSSITNEHEAVIARMKGF